MLIIGSCWGVATVCKRSITLSKTLEIYVGELKGKPKASNLVVFFFKNQIEIKNSILHVPSLYVV